MHPVSGAKTFIINNLQSAKVSLYEAPHKNLWKTQINLRPKVASNTLGCTSAIFSVSSLKRSSLAKSSV